jgi:two-component system, cell cycle response regulator
MVGKILIVDDVATNRIVLKVKLSAAFYQPLLAVNGAACLEMARNEQPDLILLDQYPPDIPFAEVLRNLALDPVTRSIPVIVMTAYRDGQARIDALAAGAQEVLSKPVDDQVLMATIRSLIRTQSSINPSADDPAQALQLAEPAAVFQHPGHIALVATDPVLIDTWRRLLDGDTGPTLILHANAQALAASLSDPARGPVPDLFALETGPGNPETNLRILSELRASPTARHSAVCLIRPDNNTDRAASALDMGADDVILPAMAPDEVLHRLRRLIARKRLSDQHRASVADQLRQALIDPLTGLYNRRYATHQLLQIGERALTDGTSFAAFVIDIDRFKAVNDHFGHVAGDAILVQVAQRMSGNLRVGDLLARIGGEEFLAVLPDVSLNEARSIAERLRSAMASQPCTLADGRRVSVTISIGLAISAATHSDDIPKLIEDADNALLFAKSAGRNQVTMGQSAA